MPTRIRKYELAEEIGRGGMGAVYRAVDAASGRAVAIKILLVEGLPGAPRPRIQGMEDQVHRFVREGQAASKLDHPNIVRVIEVGEEGGRHFLALEFVDGYGLDRLLAGGVLPPHRAFEVLRDVARGVAHAHARGVLHRDLKPSNVLIGSDGAARISDFGLARDMSNPSVPVPGMVFGTPQYMSPEQVRPGATPLGPATDIWSVGAMLYEAMTGRLPFDAEDTMRVLQRILCEDPVPPRRIRPELTREAEAVCLMCLQKAPALRYRSAEALEADLAALLDGRDVLACPPSLPKRIGRWLARRARPAP